MSKIKRLYADIETSPNVVLAFTAGYNLTINHDAIVKERKIICIAYSWEGSDKVTVLRWDDEQDDRALLAAFIPVANEADEIVAHYGNGFDFPWLRTRCLIHGLPPIPIYKTIDTKALASKYFYFNSNKLDYISKVLGFGGKLKTDFDLWKDIVLYKSQKALDKMCRYCGIDVLRLKQVFNRIEPYVRTRTHAGVMEGKDKWTCEHCGCSDVKKDKTRVTSHGTIQHQMQCKNPKCLGYYTISHTAFKAYKQAKE